MKKEDSNKNICVNRRASFDYFLEEKIEAGISLLGSEVKSLRSGQMSLAEAYALFKKNELYLIGAHIPTYLPSGQFNHNPTRDRKLLLHKKELFNLEKDLSRKGYTLIPVRCYFKNGKAKVEIALAKGKKKYDKREDIKKKSERREMRQAKNR